MELFAKQLDHLYKFMNDRAPAASCAAASLPLKWPSAGGRNVVLAEETAVELGGPSAETSSFLMWTGKKNLVAPGKVTVIGGDIPDCPSRNVPFGKVLIAEVTGFDEHNCYDRYREMASVRHSLDLKGCMVRASSPFLGEWIRISSEAVKRGFTFATLGSALLGRFASLGYIVSCEAVFVTSSADDVRILKGIGEEAMSIIGAMNKITEEADHDCGECDFSRACAEVDALKKIRETLGK